MTVSLEDPVTGRLVDRAGKIENLGIRGAGLSLDEQQDMPASTAVQLSFLNSHNRVPLCGRLVWSMPGSGADGYRCGFELRDVSDEQRRRLTELLWEHYDDIAKWCVQPPFPEMRLDFNQNSLIADFLSRRVKSYLSAIMQTYQQVRSGLISEERCQGAIEELSGKVVLDGEAMVHTFQDQRSTLSIKKTFRLATGSWSYQSRLMERAFRKPRGYPGDFILLEAIYEDAMLPEADGLGRYFERGFLNNAYAAAVRHRNRMMTSLLRNRLQHGPLPVRVLNLGCGGFRELRDLLTEEEPRYAERIRLVGLDQDPEALEFSQEKLGILTTPLQVKFIQENVVGLIKRSGEYLPLIGKQHVIYSIGLIEYLPNRILKRLIKFCLDLLDAGGQVVLAHVDYSADKQALSQLDWFCDWTFVLRSESSMVRLIREVTDYPIETRVEPSGRIFFVTITKPK